MLRRGDEHAGTRVVDDVGDLVREELRVNRDEDAATKTAVDFVKSFYTPLLHYLPA